MSTIANIYDARVKFTPSFKSTTDGKPYVQLTVSEYAGKNADGTSHYNEYHLFVWNKFDIELARSLDVGDKIVVTLERCKNCYRIDQNTGKVYPYTSGNVCTNSISAIYTNTPSVQLRNYEAAQQQRRDGLKQQNQVAGNGLVQPQSAQPQIMQAQASQPVQNFAPAATTVAPATTTAVPVTTTVANAQTQASVPQAQPSVPQSNSLQSTVQPEQAAQTTQNFDSAPWPVHQPVQTSAPQGQTQTQPPVYQPSNVQPAAQSNTAMPDGAKLPAGYEVIF